MVEILSARPPTPPRTFFNRDSDHLQSRQDVPDTPSAAESTILRTSKKVNFSPITSYIKPATASGLNPVSNPAIRSIPPSNECKPAKSILKMTSGSSLAPTATEENEQQPFAVQLESAIQQLAGESVSSRVDAYIHLLGSAKKYENVPEQSAMVSKVGLLAQFIQRDVDRDFGKGEVLEMNLATNALKFAIFLVWSEALSIYVPDDFKIFIVDHSISALQDGKLPKTLLIHYTHVLYNQNFSPKIMTNSRITRILAALSDLTDRVNGNGIISQRLGVYTRLVGQDKTVMAAHASLWVENLISGLLHPMKDVRSKALVLGNQISVILGPNLNISKTILDIFNKELPQGRKLMSEICERMSRMMSPVDSGVHVPQIWSIIVLLLRSKRFVMEEWKYFKEWVLVLQKCFNCSEPLIKIQAILGWNRFVYVITCNNSTSTSMMRMLTKPIVSQFERKKTEKPGSSVNRVVLSSYYNLLYYAFRPSASYEHYDFIWEEYVNQPLAKFFTTSSHLNDSACNALASLLWSSQPKVWTENKINESSKVEPENIFPIDCKWTRSRIGSVLKTFEALFTTSTWASGNDRASDIAVAWTNLCKALAEASSKEIKASTELTQAIAAVLNLFQRLRQGAPASLNAETNDTFLERLSFLSTTVITAIGPSPFTEKALLKTAQETYQAANTPTRHRASSDSSLDTPFMHILRILSSFGEDSKLGGLEASIFEGLLEAVCRGRQSRGSRLELLEKCTLLRLRDSEIDPELVGSIWEATARLTINCLTSFPMETPRDRDGTVTRDYDKVTKILAHGLQFEKAFQIWGTLLDACVRVVRTERGERSVASLIIEPLATESLQLSRGLSFWPLKTLTNQALSLSYYQKGETRGSMTSLGQEPIMSNHSLFPEKLLGLITKVTTEAYEHFNADENTATAEVMESLTALLGSGTSQFRSKLLESLQAPLSLWVKDSARCLTSENGTSTRLLTACRTLSWAVANILQTAVPHDTKSLRTFEGIVSAGLESVHKSTANRFIETWNTSFGLQASVTYPPAVQLALEKLDPFVELQLPCPLPVKDSSKNYGIPDLVESQDTDSSFDSAQDLITKDLKNRFRRKQRPATFSSSPITQLPENNAETLQPARADMTPRRRLRHDNSQIQFVPIESSPLPSDIESQLLTERQREVKERQRGSNAMFLDDLPSSSPALPSPTKDTGVLTPVKLPDLQDSELALHGLSTPTLAANVQENDDDFPGSSPTPSAKDRSVQSQNKSSLPIETLNVAQEDVAPPSKIQSRSARRRAVRRKSALRRSESYASDSEDRVATGSGRRRSARHSVNRSSEPTTEEALVQEASPKQSNKPDSNIKTLPEPEDEPLDEIPDTYRDEFEQQLASQLEQDLELAVDLQDIENSQSSNTADLPPAPLTRKRKRDTVTDSEHSTVPNRGKRRSLRSSQSTATEGNVEGVSKENDTTARSTSRRAGPSAKDIVTPQLSPAKGVTTPDPVTDNTSTLGSKRRSRRLTANDAPEIPSSPLQAQPPSLKRRRSQRLSGILSSPVTNSVSVPTTPRKQQKHSQSSPINADTSTPSSRSLRKRTRLAEVSATSDANDSTENTTNDAEPEPTLPSEVLNQQTKIIASDEPSPQESAQGREDDVEVNMEDPDSSVLALAEVHKKTGEYISHEVQTNSMVDAGAENQGSGILSSLRRVLSDMKNVSFGRGVLREIDDLMFDIRVEAVKRSRA
ncbi:Midasin [Talaromyces islandicus]|uniref:Midasin n=1 Tax=Talaromyces islandicus TaxID=28573 RepID=A0A0U1M3E9_TALIS|nr:Midasin [Talaromyces islandicus]